MSTFVGIDLGTTYSVIAYINSSGQPDIIPNDQENRTTPSVVDLGSTPAIVGDEAKEKQTLGDTGIYAFFKRDMGNSNALYIENDKEFTPVDLSSMVLAYLKGCAEQFLNETITDAVITVPAYFNNLQRQATIEAGKKAGLNVLRIISEPTAAALAYGIRPTTTTSKILVYDLGGGTFDVSLIEVTPDELRVIATSGDHMLGGKDWDDRILQYLSTEFERDFGVDLIGDDFNDLMTLAEKTKVSLSTKQLVRVTAKGNGHSAIYDISRTLFEDLTRDLLERTQMLVEQVLKDANLAWVDLEGALLVGGSTRMPMVRDYVERMSGKPAMTGINPDEAVALGAAIQAAIDLEECKKPTEPILMLSGRKRSKDVISHSLGVLVQSEKGIGFINSIIIPKNAPIPCTKSRPYKFRTQKHQNNQLDVYVLQGESHNPDQCISVGKYTFLNIPHLPGIPTIIDIEYGYSESGIITVYATERSSSTNLFLTVEEPKSDFLYLSGKTDSLKAASSTSPYTIHAGKQRIPGSISDQYGNPKGSQFDLVSDNTFEDCLIAVLHLYTDEKFDFKLPEVALKEKGFKIHRWTRVPNFREFQSILEDACQLWLISSHKQFLDHRYRQEIKAFFDSGRGIYIWGDNDPYFADANFISDYLLNCRMYGNSYGNQVIKLRQNNQKSGFVSHLITTGLEHLYEGITIATIQINSSLQPLIYGSDGNVVTAFHDHQGRRAIIDGGFTRLFCNWDTAGTERYVKNAAGWLVNYERLWIHQINNETSRRIKI